MVGWHHRLNGHEFERTLGVAEGQRSLASCSPWGCKESDMTEQVNINNIPTMECYLALKRMEVFLFLFIFFRKSF